MPCPTQWMIEQIGDRWKLHLLHQLARGAQRTHSLMAGLKGISSRTLSAKLKALEADGWIARHVYPDAPPRVEYELTERGRAVIAVLSAFKQVGAAFSGTDSDCPNCRALSDAHPPRASRTMPSSREPSTRSRPSQEDIVLL